MTSRQRFLILIAGLSGLIYLLVFTWPFPLFRLYNTIPPVDYAKLTHHSPAGLVAYVAGLGALFGLYLWAIHLTVPGQGVELPLSPRPIFLAGAILAGILVFSYPLTAIDLFIYAIRTRGYALYSLNPLATAPEALPAGDPWLGLAAEWVDAPSPYGPLWEGLSLAGFYLSGGDFLAHLVALKIIAALAYLGCAWLVYQILQHLRPEWAMAGTIAFAWSPLVLLESVQNGHNDMVMVFFLLAAVWLLAKREGGRLKSALLAILVCLFLALSILVKFVTAMVVPFFLWELAKGQPGWPRRLGTFFGFGFVVAGVVALSMFPLWPGWEQWAIMEAGGQAGRSLLALLVLALRNPLGLNLAFDLARNFILVVFALIYLYCLFLRSPAPPPPRSPAPLLPCSPAPLPPCSPAPLPPCPFLVLFWYVLLAVPVFHAWYLLWFLPLAALLLPYRSPLRAATVFSITALFIIPYFETIRVWYPALLENQLLGHLIGVPLLIGPPALALIWPISSRAESEVR